MAAYDKIKSLRFTRGKIFSAFYRKYEKWARKYIFKMMLQ